MQSRDASFNSKRARSVARDGCGGEATSVGHSGSASASKIAEEKLIAEVAQQIGGRMIQPRDGEALTVDVVILAMAQQIEVLQGGLTVEQKARAESEVKLAELQENLEASQGRIKEEKEQNRQLIIQTRDLQGELTASRKGIQAMQRQNVCLAEENLGLKRALQASGDMVQEMQQQNQQLEARNADLHRELIALKTCYEGERHLSSGFQPVSRPSHAVSSGSGRSVAELLLGLGSPWTQSSLVPEGQPRSRDSMPLDISPQRVRPG